MKRILCALVSCILLMPLTAVAAGAGPQPEPGPDSLVIDWRQLGLSDELVVTAARTANVEAPGPQGLTPRVVTGEISVTAGTTGRVDVLDRDGATIGTIALPADVNTAPFAVDISAAGRFAGNLNLRFALNGPAPVPESCSKAPSVTLTKLATAYSGSTPLLKTVADFRPSYLNQIAIWLGPDPAPEQQQAALTLVAKLTHLYQPMPVRIDVDTSPAPPPAGDISSRRTIAIREGGAPGLAVVNPDSPNALLTITGTGSELTQQVELFTDRRLELAQTPTAAVTSTGKTVETSTDTLSFRELGINPQTSVWGTRMLYVGFDAARFGVGQIDGATFNMVLEHSPVAAGDASVTVRSGTDILASTRLNDSSRTELSGDIPAAAISSNVGIALEVRYQPQAQDCESGGMTFSIDPASTITVHPGTKNRGGFAMLPMAFTPDFDVALQSPDQIRYAAQAINLMGQQSTVTLQPTLTSLADAAKRGVGLLAVASGEQLQREGMRPPLLVPGTNAVDVNGADATGLDLGGSLGIVQAFADNGRIVLGIDASGSGELADRSLDYVRGMEGRWGSLTGDVVATGAAGGVVNLSMSTRQGMAPPVSDGWRWWTWSTLGLIAVGVPALAGLALVRRRRAKRSHPELPA